ncbi:CoA transferase subunit A [Microvirga sp. VF16]|uniref:CoA transferase subunit A n=1 Tax=Microvirga sp. VF16 TaxID=2807101 RepID=UPI00193CEC0E|nr:CoA-transferase [Microvirga sp. VF16]QRM33962.1 CoA transferase subunit A [Microvirga sp. VF16]
MSTGTNKVVTLSEAVSLIKDGDLVAIGGHAAHGHPIALVREIIRQGRRRLHIAGLSNGIDMDMLVGAGCVGTVETSHVAIDGSDLPPNYRRAAEDGTIQVIGHSETTALSRFRAASVGAPYILIRSELGVDPRTNPHLREVTDVFSGDPYVAVEAIRPDIALIHAHAADDEGNVQLSVESCQHTITDMMIAQSARAVIVSVEQIVSAKAIKSRPNATLPHSAITCVVEVPFGAHPCSYNGRYEHDREHLAQYIAASATAAGLEQWLDGYVRAPADNDEFLERIGMKRLMDISTKRLIRQ